ncbi:MAG: type II toxin-antitoxin system VapC family toxin [Planctomycetota bacterium]
MIALDTNILVKAHRRDADGHAAAARVVRELAEGVDPWLIPVPCLHEFLAVVTHPRIFDPPSRAEQALDQVQAWMESPTLSIASESPRHWATIASVIRESGLVGASIHDARVAAICIDHGVRTLLTADRDFTKVKGLRVQDPLRG